MQNKSQNMIRESSPIPQIGTICRTNSTDSAREIYDDSSSNVSSDEGVFDLSSSSGDDDMCVKLGLHEPLFKDLPRRTRFHAECSNNAKRHQPYTKGENENLESNDPRQERKIPRHKDFSSRHFLSPNGGYSSVTPDMYLHKPKGYIRLTPVTFEVNPMFFEVSRTQRTTRSTEHRVKECGKFNSHELEFKGIPSSTKTLDSDMSDESQKGMSSLLPTCSQGVTSSLNHTCSREVKSSFSPTGIQGVIPPLHTTGRHGVMPPLSQTDRKGVISSLKQKGSQGVMPSLNPSGWFRETFRNANGDMIAKDHLSARTKVAVIARAIMKNPRREMLIPDIYNHISTHYPKLTTQINWKKGVRYTLSHYECFLRLEKSISNKHYWTIHPACTQSFEKEDFCIRNSKRLVLRYNQLRQGSLTKVPKTPYNEH